MTAIAPVVLGRHRHVGDLLLAFRGEPQHVTAWEAGAVGEERVGARVDRLTGAGVVVLHDRRIPGTRGRH